MNLNMPMLARIHAKDLVIETAEFLEITQICAYLEAKTVIMEPMETELVVNVSPAIIMSMPN